MVASRGSVATLEVEVRTVRVVQPMLGVEERDAAVAGLSHLLRTGVLVDRDADLVRGAIEGLTTAPEAAELAKLDKATLGRFRRESPESRQAALSNFPRSGTQRATILYRISRAGAKGATRDELAEWLGLGVSTVNPRVRELLDGGWLEVASDPQGKRRTRKTRAGQAAAVMVLTARAEAELRKRGWAGPR